MYTLIIFVLERHYHTLLHNRQCFCNLNLSLRKKRHQNLKNFWRRKKKNLSELNSNKHTESFCDIFTCLLSSQYLSKIQNFMKKQENFNKKIIMSYYTKKTEWAFVLFLFSLWCGFTIFLKQPWQKARMTCKNFFPSFLKRLYPFLLLLSISKSLFSFGKTVSW